MADNTDTTRPGEAAAVKRALAIAGETVRDTLASCESVVEDVVAAAYPVIAAAVREQVAQERMHGDHQFQPGIDTDMIAEGRQPDPRWCNICGEAP